MDSRLVWLALAAFVGATEGGSIAGLLPFIAAETGVSIGQAGLLIFGYSLAYAVGPPLLAVMLGGVGRRRILGWAEFALAACALLIALTPLFEGLVGARMLLAVAAGTFTGTAMATAAMIAAPGQRGRALQTVSLGQSLAGLVGVPLAVFAAAHFGWRANYAAIALMAAAAALALYLGLPRGMHGDTQTMRDRIRVLGNPGVLPALLVTLLMMTGATPVMVYVAAVMAEAGIGLAYLPLVLLASGVGAVATSMTAGRLADRLGNRRAVIAALSVVIAGLGGFVALPHLPTGLHLPVLLALFTVQSYVGWGYWIAHSSQMAHLAPSSVPVAISLNMSAMNIGMAIAAAAGGFVVDTWGASALPLAGLPVVVAALVLWVATVDRGGRQ
jgi:predicted MFS family arabinose efflux permease